MRKRSYYGYYDFIHPYDVSFPESLLSFFRPLKRFVPVVKGKNSVPLTYDEIEGRAYPLPDDLSSWEDHPEIEEYPCDNIDSQSKSRSDRASVRAIKVIFGGNTYSNVEKSYMRASRTRPIKLNFKVNGHKTKQCVYVKKADTNRIIGRFLYDIISGFEGIDYAFNTEVFLEQGISGSLLSHLDERIYLQFPDYRIGIVRAAVHAEFMGLYDDILDSINRIVDSEMRTVLFDFDVLFGPKDPASCNLLLGPYLENNLFSQSDLEIYFEEQFNVVRRVRDNEDQLFKLASIAGDLVDGTGKTLNDRICDSWNAFSFSDYLERTLERFESASARQLSKRVVVPKKPLDPRRDRYSIRGLK